MLTWIREKFGSIIIAIIIGLIGFVFVVSGVFSPKATRGLHPGAVAGTVNDEPITIQEFNRSLNQRIEYFKNMTGGKITEEQIKAFRLREAVFNDLVSRKIMLQQADQVGLTASDAEIKEQIQKMPVFQKDGKFDILTYKKILSANQYTAGGFERLMREDLSSQQWGQYFKNRVNITQAEVKDAFVKENKKRSLRYVSIPFEAGKKKVASLITEAEITQALTDEKKLAIVKNQFEAKKETEFKGKTLDDVKNLLMRETLASEKTEEIKKASLEIGQGALTLMGDTNQKQLDSYLKPFGIEVQKAEQISNDQTFLPGAGEAKEIIQDAFHPSQSIYPKAGGQAKLYQIGIQTIIAIVTDSKDPNLNLLQESTPALLEKLSMQKEREAFEQWMKLMNKKVKLDKNPDVLDPVT